MATNVLKFPGLGLEVGRKNGNAYVFQNSKFSLSTMSATRNLYHTGKVCIMEGRLVYIFSETQIFLL